MQLRKIILHDLIGENVSWMIHECGMMNLIVRIIIVNVAQVFQGLTFLHLEYESQTLGLFENCLLTHFI